MGGKTILLGWELGAGFGYCIALRELAAALSHAGHEPTLALRSVDHSYRLFADRDFPVVQAPWIIGRLTERAWRNGFSPTGFADLMACNGFGSVDHLYSIARSWRDLIDLVRPDLIVARYSPNLTLAAYGRIPVVLFGSAYSTPPADGDTFPRFRTDIEPFADQDRMLETARTVQRKFNAPEPARITDVYRGEHRFVGTLPELDPYQDGRNEQCWGDFEPGEPPERAHERRFYAYLAGSSPLALNTVRGLVDAGMPGQIYIRDTNWRHIELRSRHLVEFLDEAPDIATACRRAAVVIHHGGHGTTHAALAAGRPQILVPQVLDQLLTSNLLSTQRFVMSLAGEFTAREVSAGLNAIVQDEEASAEAMAYADSIQARQLHNSKQRVIDACLKELS